jgi:hypothetical protein
MKVVTIMYYVYGKHNYNKYWTQSHKGSTSIEVWARLRRPSHIYIQRLIGSHIPRCLCGQSLAVIGQDEAQIHFCDDHIPIIHAPVFLWTCIHDVCTTRSGKNWSTFSWGRLSCGANGFWISGSSWDRQQGNDRLESALGSWMNDASIDLTSMCGYCGRSIMFCSGMGRINDNMYVDGWKRHIYSCGSKCKWTPFGGGAL